MTAYGHVHNATYPLVQLPDLRSGLSFGLEFLGCSTIDDAVSEGGSLGDLVGGNFCSPARQPLSSFLADAAPRRDRIQYNVGRFARRLRKQQGRFDRLQIER